ncbi:MAG: hypothetical protein PHU51_05775, partial [Candidatus Nanoarchaeia archaeon]|nr:hypothetical protein [Candidatus Nanoarchaeia archaeon]
NLEMDYFKSQDDLFAKYFENLNIYNTPLFVDGVFHNPNSLLEESVDLLKGSLFLDHEELHYEVGAYRSLNEVENKIIRNAHLNPDLLKKYILLTSQKRTAVGRIPLESINIKGLDLFIDFKGPEKFRRFGDKRSYSKQEIFGKEFSVEDILLNLRVGNPYEHHEGLTRLIETPLCNAGNWNQGLDPTTASELMGKISKAITAKDYEIELSTEIPENFPIMKFYEKTRDKKYADYQRRLWAGNYSMKYGFYINNFTIEDFPLIVDGGPTDIKKYFTSPKKLDK